MAIVEVRTLPRAKANHIRVLQKRGRIKFLVSEKGYVCYDTEEFDNYTKNVKWGRPVKM